MNLRPWIYCLLLGSFFLGCSSNPAVEETPAPVQAEEPAPPPPPPAPEKTYAWGYEGDKGPDRWASLNPDYISCEKGKKQSPVNLTWKAPIKKSPRLDFSYTNAQATVDTTTMVPKLIFSGANQLLLNGKVFNLESIEFHSPSEHQLSNNPLSMEIEFVHKAISGGGVAILSVFAIEGHDNSLLNEIWPTFSAGTGTLQLDASKLIPPTKTYYHYVGSMTTPPCSEGVEWIVYNTPMEASRDQIVAFRSLFPANNRPIQPLNGRKVTNH